ncbi:MAG: hypothetical protein KGL91_10225 [Xanthomonadaceae bacterium]|nr:hypothetical protein [Xanthomonadaceae bacterium]
MRKLPLLASLVLAVCTLPALAQKQAENDWDKIVLEQAKGSVMTSTGGDYSSATIGDVLVVGQHMLLAGAQPGAQLVYYKLGDNGQVLRKCVRDYDQANTYVVDASCVAGVARAGSSARIGASAGIIMGAALLGGALSGSGKSTPVSSGSR